MNRRVLLLALVVFSAAAAQTQTFRITGIVLNRLATEPVSNAHLTATPDLPCRSSPQAPETDTDASGRFALTVPCAGIWRLSASAPHFPKQLFEQHETFSTGIVLTPAHPSFDLTFPVDPNSSISGLVLDEAGEAVRNAQLTLLTTDAESAPHPIANTQTDDRGSYEFPDLAPGAYLVAVQAQPWYAVAAQPVSRFVLQQSATSGPVDQAAQRSVREEATQQVASSSPIEPSLDMAYPITWFPAATDPESATQIQLAGGAATQADFHLSPIPSIHVRIPASASRPLGPGPDREYRFTAPPSIEQVSALGEISFRPTAITVAEDGSLDLAGFAPGNYLFDQRFGRGRKDRSPDTIPQTLKLSAGSSRAVDLPLAAIAENTPPDLQTSTMTGHVASGGKPAEAAMLLLVSTTPGALIRRQQTNTDGSFKFDQVPTGKYILAAIDHGWTINWRDPAALASFLTHGTAIALTAAPATAPDLEAQTP